MPTAANAMLAKCFRRFTRISGSLFHVGPAIRQAGGSAAVKARIEEYPAPTAARASPVIAAAIAWILVGIGKAYVCYSVFVAWSMLAG